MNNDELDEEIKKMEEEVKDFEGGTDFESPLVLP